MQLSRCRPEDLGRALRHPRQSLSLINAQAGNVARLRRSIRGLVILRHLARTRLRSFPNARARSYPRIPSSPYFLTSALWRPFATKDRDAMLLGILKKLFGGEMSDRATSPIRHVSALPAMPFCRRSTAVAREKASGKTARSSMLIVPASSVQKHTTSTRHAPILPVTSARIGYAVKQRQTPNSTRSTTS